MTENRDTSVEELHARMLKKRLWVVMTKAVAPPEEVRQHLKAHLQHQIALERAGIMYGAGPATRPGETAAAFGLIIIRAENETAARRIADFRSDAFFGRARVRALRVVAQRRAYHHDAEFLRSDLRVRLVPRTTPAVRRLCRLDY